MPHAMVSVGSHSLGDVRLRMMLHGICALRQSSSLLENLHQITYLEQHVTDKVERQARQILITS